MKSCTVIVTAANALTRPIHDRMPVVLKDFEPWLSGAAGTKVLTPAPENMLRARLEHVDHKRNNQSAEIQHPAEGHPILRLTPTGWNLRQGQDGAPP